MRDIDTSKKKTSSCLCEQDTLLTAGSSFQSQEKFQKSRQLYHERAQQTKSLGKTRASARLFPIGVPGISIKDGKLLPLCLYPVANCSAHTLLESLVTPQKEYRNVRIVREGTRVLQLLSKDIRWVVHTLQTIVCFLNQKACAMFLLNCFHCTHMNKYCPRDPGNIAQRCHLQLEMSE